MADRVSETILKRINCRSSGIQLIIQANFEHFLAVYSFLHSREGNHTVYVLCKDTSHGKSTAYFSAHTLNASPSNGTVLKCFPA